MSDELRYFLLRSGCNVPSSDQLGVHTSRLILAGLADHADYDHKLYVSYRGLARELALSPSTTFVAYKLYESLNILQRTGKRRSTGGATEYRLCLDSLTPTHSGYSLPSALSTPPTSDSRTDSPSASPSASPSDSPSALPSALSTHARNRSENVSENRSPSSREFHRTSDMATPAHVHELELLRQALKLELEHRPSRMPLEFLMGHKERSYLPVCRSVLERYPLAQPATNPDRDLALAVCELTNPELPALRLSPAGHRELERRYCTPAAEEPF